MSYAQEQEIDTASMTQEDLTARLNDVVSQISSIGIQIEELIDVTLIGRGGPSVTAERRILMDKRNFLYREERLLRNHLRQIDPDVMRLSERNHDLERKLQEKSDMIIALQTRISELKDKLDKSKELTRHELYTLQTLRAKTRKTISEAYQDGLNKGDADNLRLLGVLHAVANGDKRVLDAVERSFKFMKKPLPAPIIDESGVIRSPPDPNRP